MNLTKHSIAKLSCHLPINDITENCIVYYSYMKITQLQEWFFKELQVDKEN